MEEGKIILTKNSTFFLIRTRYNFFYIITFQTSTNIIHLSRFKKENPSEEKGFHPLQTERLKHKKSLIGHLNLNSLRNKNYRLIMKTLSLDYLVPVKLKQMKVFQLPNFMLKVMKSELSMIKIQWGSNSLCVKRHYMERFEGIRT